MGLVRVLNVSCAVFGLILTIAGALGAHVVNTEQAVELTASWDSALLYGFMHLVIAFVAIRLGEPSLAAKLASITFLIGVVFFSFNILAATGLEAQAVNAGRDEDPLGALNKLAPVGGISFMIGWVCLAVDGWTKSYAD